MFILQEDTNWQNIFLNNFMNKTIFNIFELLQRFPSLFPSPSLLLLLFLFNSTTPGSGSIKQLCFLRLEAVSKDFYLIFRHKIPSGPQVSFAEAAFEINSNWPRYLNSKMTIQGGPFHGIDWFLQANVVLKNEWSRHWAELNLST